MTILVPKEKHSIIRICKIVLKINRDINFDDVCLLKTKIQEHLDSGMSPADIKKFYSIKYTDFGMFIKKCLGMKIYSVKDAVNNFYRKNNRSNTDEKQIYKKQCDFKFDPFSIPEIPGYALLQKFGVYHPINNPNGVCRDHMVSIEFGWRNKIDPILISHPMNCQFITNIENISKGSKSCIDIETLLDRIKNSRYEIIENMSISLPKTRSHKQKISATNSKYMNITNGNHNLRVMKSTIIPEGYRRGMTRRHKMVVRPGVEPGNEIF